MLFLKGSCCCCLKLLLKARILPFLFITHYKPYPAPTVKDTAACCCKFSPVQVLLWFYAWLILILARREPRTWIPSEPRGTRGHLGGAGSFRQFCMRLFLPANVCVCVIFHDFFAAKKVCVLIFSVCVRWMFCSMSDIFFQCRTKINACFKCFFYFHLNIDFFF